jgi:hypothetical protein
VTTTGDARGKDLNCRAGPFTGAVAVSELADHLPYAS